MEPQDKVTNLQSGDPSPPAQASEAKPVFGGAVSYVTDNKGRKIGLKKPTPGERFELDDCVAVNTPAAAVTVSVVGFVVSIDQEGLPPLWSYAPKARDEFKKRLNLLGDEGLMAITTPVLKMMGLELDEKAIGLAKNW